MEIQGLKLSDKKEWDDQLDTKMENYMETETVQGM